MNNVFAIKDILSMKPVFNAQLVPFLSQGPMIIGNGPCRPVVGVSRLYETTTDMGANVAYRVRLGVHNEDCSDVVAERIGMTIVLIPKLATEEEFAELLWTGVMRVIGQLYRRYIREENGISLGKSLTVEEYVRGLISVGTFTDKEVVLVPKGHDIVLEREGVVYFQDACIQTDYASLCCVRNEEEQVIGTGAPRSMKVSRLVNAIDAAIEAKVEHCSEFAEKVIAI
ncbi:hypothetical protein D9_0247 [Aeromonas phage D9]|uniref:Uncharacterized protein n=1 Tax=Aeromonas phage D6 TaxID=2593322 RepID=A0A514TW88_9CAUD|nr:hypothetical protein PQC08_gp126 [Aeromonas phage D6]QDJ97309.1 hypothetical protein D6_0149 [Aeromonas phage D6]QEP52454.1 hypothetical protein D9_0247 [Aeromonas phage D9]